MSMHEDHGPRRGFTLIELLMVVVIIGILASIVVLKFSEMKDKAFVSTMQSDLRNLSSAQETYYASNFSYTSDVTALEFNSSDAVEITVNESGTAGWGATATHSGLGVRQCGVYYGDADASSGSPATIAGSIACN